MYIVVTRSFPPEVGGMQNLMWGLTCSIAKYNMVKVFADFHENYKEHDQKVSFSIDRVGGIKQEEVEIRGHAIEVRVNAENPWTLEPSPGRVWECIWPGGQGVRIDSHIHTGYDIPASFDSLLAKIIVWAPNRREAIKKMISTIDEVILTGVDTLIPLHKRILNENDFKDKEITIKYLEEHPELMRERI